MNKLELQSYLLDRGLDDLVIIDDFDDAFIGVVDDGSYSHAVYSYSRMVYHLLEDGMDECSAIDHIEYNVMRSLPYQGDYQPVIMQDMDSDEILDDDISEGYETEKRMS